MHIFCAAPIQSGACGQNGCLHASGHPGRYMRRRQRNGGSAWAILRRKLGTAEEKRRVGTGIWTAFGTTDPLSFAGGERISRETGRNSGSALRHFYRGNCRMRTNRRWRSSVPESVRNTADMWPRNWDSIWEEREYRSSAEWPGGLTGSASRQRYLREELPMVCWDAEWISVIPHRIEDV